jgi:hypothetical protein
MVAKVWRKLSPYWHLIMALIGGFCFVILKYDQVDGYQGRIAALETSQVTLEKKVTRTDFNVQMIANRLGVKPLKEEE